MKKKSCTIRLRPELLEICPSVLAIIVAALVLVYLKWSISKLNRFVVLLCQ